MNAPGTIGRPAPHGPATLIRVTTADVIFHTSTGDATAPQPDAVLPRRKQNRNRTLHLINEAMARSHMEYRLQEARDQRLAQRLALAGRLERRSRRLHRRAERASRRARLVRAQHLGPTTTNEHR